MPLRCLDEKTSRMYWPRWCKFHWILTCTAFSDEQVCIGADHHQFIRRHRQQFWIPQSMHHSHMYFSYNSIVQYYYNLSFWPELTNCWLSQLFLSLQCYQVIWLQMACNWKSARWIWEQIFSRCRFLIPVIWSPVRFLSGKDPVKSSIDF